MTLNPSSLSGTQWLNLWSKGFWEEEREEERERGRERRKEIKGSKVEKERRKEGKGFLGLLIFDLERLCEGGMSISRRVGWWLGLPREGKGKEKGFWVLVVLACFWGWFLVFGFWWLIDGVDGTKVLITIKGMGLKVWVFFWRWKRLKIKGFFACF
jgi:hypothetical protein